MKMFALFYSALFLAVLPLSAHPTGHEGGLVETVKHIVAHPDHLLVWGAAFLVGGWLIWRAGRVGKEKTKAGL